MMQPLLNAMRLQAMMESGSKVSMLLAVVSSYDQTNYCAKVMLQPEGYESGWLPVASPWVGNGWGMFMPPTPGDLVQVNFQEDDINAGIVGLRQFTDASRPLSVPAGEFWLVHKSGSLLKFHNDGTTELTSNGTLTVKAPGINLQNAGTALLKLLNSAFSTWAQNHVHSNGNGGANTGVPTSTPAANTQTSIVQAE
ncbi:phage baseplate assembly protein V [Sideroxydans lithotrophicus]|uniref:Phage baseplate assembly protein V n=1 Tax=Sideroxydans lithotrophicus (strain ES-1) TaxID=580332 RepID=D5CT43_SIDLE|nr:phage baseplate assembly protein V [Sideroxydans lithotrophicus]ADE12129.1 phage baseplate assembly protein V [Sideroxydans lithotrophicus ES-1]